jgi:uncharacterized protein involved in type VI secretion and phage assembly
MSDFKTPAVSRRRMEELTAGAKHARSRYDLYKAKTHSSRPTDPKQLRELKRESELAQMRLIQAKAKSNA